MLVYFVILLHILCQGEGSDEFESFWRGGLKEGTYYRADDPDSKGNQDNIIRPCSFHDVECIRHVFSRHSSCYPVKGGVPEPYMLKRLADLPLPLVNMSVTLINGEFKGLNDWKIKEFYINKAVDVLVLEVEFNKITVSCPSAPITYYRKGKEPLEVTDYTWIEYDNLSFTLTIPHVQDLRLSKGHVFTYISEPSPKYLLGPGFYASKDPGLQRAMAEMELSVPAIVRELFVSQGPAIFSIFFQNNICDFAHY